MGKCFLREAPENDGEHRKKGGKAIVLQKMQTPLFEPKIQLDMGLRGM
jgi:hypothetical protein